MKIRSRILPLVLSTLALLALAPQTFAAQPEPDPTSFDLCSTDNDCPIGSVCEPTNADCDSDRRCVSGCRDGIRGCGPLRSCEPVQCVSCPCADLCVVETFGDLGDPGHFSVAVDPSNPDNPYDAVGQLHNAALDDAIQARQLLEDGSGSVDPLLFTLVAEQRIRDFVCAGVEPCTLKIPGLQTARILVDFEGTRASVANTFDRTQRPYFDRTFEILGTHTLGVDGQIQQLRDMESEILAALSEEQAEPLLRGITVARHSLAYWHTQSSVDSPWNLDPTTLDQETFDSLLLRIPQYDSLGGFIVPGYVHPIMASAMIIMWMIIDLFI